MDPWRRKQREHLLSGRKTRLFRSLHLNDLIHSNDTIRDLEMWSSNTDFGYCARYSVLFSFKSFHHYNRSELFIPSFCYNGMTIFNSNYPITNDFISSVARHFIDCQSKQCCFKFSYLFACIGMSNVRHVPFLNRL